MPAIDPDLHTGFAFALLRAVAATTSPGQGVVVSPWSVASALAVLAPGCDDAARREIEQVLTASLSPGDDVAAALAAQAQLLMAHRPQASGEDDALVVANRLWVDAGRTAQPAFAAALERWPGAAVRAAPISSEPEVARATINADVAETTRDLIPEILPPGSITAQDRAVVVNALYLLAGWIERFAVESTVDESFHSPSGRRPVPTMRAHHELRYASGDGWQYLALPLGPDLAAEVLLPPPAPADEAEAGSRDEMVAGANPALVAALRDEVRRHRVDLHLPRFRVESHIDLTSPLHRVGIARIFDHDGSVPSVVVGEPLWISGAFHAAVLRADERGIEGAAATALVARAVAFVDLPEVELRVDRPFLVLVTHPATRVVLFVAYVTEP